MPLMLAVNDQIHGTGYNGINLAAAATTADSDVNNDNVVSISSMMMNYLSPEYISCASKKAMFSESDIEKVSD